ncbi:hypothetical protein FB45DRAFT_1010111 [Roridomyces roridus]|uniref:CFEM domain-containing protein n=1 Tax=Roridomyces roridus TaxID=1738132 RepID=A0AAD7B3Q8_9AGAR|nr:hypothetical protein FB45DRAFT_1010111 [Roridomyces roridus]
MVFKRTPSPSPCVQRCAGSSNQFERTNCNPSDSACLCLSGRFVAAVEDCVAVTCPNELPTAARSLRAQCVTATHSLLNPRQDAGGTAPPVPGPTGITPLPSPAPSHTAAIAGGIVGGLVAVALIALTVWCMRGRIRQRFERVPPATSPSPAQAGTPLAADRMELTRDGSTLALDRPVPPAVVASQVEMWEKMGSRTGREYGSGAGGSFSSLPSSSGAGAARVPDKEPQIDFGSLLWNNSTVAPAETPRTHDPNASIAASGGSGSASTSLPTTPQPDPATAIQLRVMTDRVAQLEAALSARTELPPNYTQ